MEEKNQKIVEMHSRPILEDETDLLTSELNPFEEMKPADGAKTEEGFRTLDDVKL